MEYSRELAPLDRELFAKHSLPRFTPPPPRFISQIPPLCPGFQLWPALHSAVKERQEKAERVKRTLDELLDAEQALKTELNELSKEKLVCNFRGRGEMKKRRL